MNEAQAHLFTKQKKPPALKKLPPTDANLMLHVLRAHHQMLLWKAADKHDPPQETENIVNFKWNIKGSTVMPAISTTSVAPQALLDIVSCNCVAQGKACSSLRCSCHSAGLSCTNYCKCEGGDACHSHFTSKQANGQDDEGNLDDDH